MGLPCLKPLPLYRPRDPQASDLWRLLDGHSEAFREVYTEGFQAKYGFWRPDFDQRRRGPPRSGSSRSRVYPRLPCLQHPQRQAGLFRPTQHEPKVAPRLIQMPHQPRILQLPFLENHDVIDASVQISKPYDIYFRVQYIFFPTCSRNGQPMYNPKARYLPIRQKSPLRK